MNITNEEIARLRALEAAATPRMVFFRVQHAGGRFSWEVRPACGRGDKTTGYGGMCFGEGKEKP